MNIHWCIIVSIKLPFYGCMHHVTKEDVKTAQPHGDFPLPGIITGGSET